MILISRLTFWKYCVQKCYFFLMLLDKLMLNKNIGTVSKTGVGATLPGVQIPLSPPQFKHLAHLLSAISLTLRILREKRIAILCFFCQKRGPGMVLFLLFDHKSTPGFLPRSFAVPHRDSQWCHSRRLNAVVLGNRRPRPVARNVPL